MVLGGSPTITINQQTFTLAGVLPPDAEDVMVARMFPGAEVWTPLQYSEQVRPSCRTCRHILVVARLKDGVTPTEAQADLARIFQSLAMRFPAEYNRPRPVVTPVRDYVLGPVTTPLYLLWGAVALLLLITCTNIANLLLIRASERAEEIAVRRALSVPVGTQSRARSTRAPRIPRHRPDSPPRIPAARCRRLPPACR